MAGMALTFDDLAGMDAPTAEMLKLYDTAESQLFVADIE